MTIGHVMMLFEGLKSNESYLPQTAHNLLKMTCIRPTIHDEVTLRVLKSLVIGTTFAAKYNNRLTKF